MPNRASIGPTLMPGEPASGGWEPHEGVPSARRWRGAPQWAVRHGEALCHWSYGRPVEVDGVLLPDGTRGWAECFRGWRRPTGDNGYLHGDVTFRDGDATFVDAEVQPRSAPILRDEGVPDMEFDMLSSDAMRVAAEDDGFAQALYAAMCNVDWRKQGSARRWHCSWRHAGGIVADLRDKGEIYIDFYCSGMGTPDGAAEGVVTDAVADALGRLGWRPLTADESNADHDAAAARILELLEQPEGTGAEWYLGKASGHTPRAPDLETWAGRLHHLAATGRVNQAEWPILWERIDQLRDQEKVVERLGLDLPPGILAVPLRERD